MDSFQMEAMSSSVSGASSLQSGVEQEPEQVEEAQEETSFEGGQVTSFEGVGGQVTSFEAGGTTWYTEDGAESSCDSPRRGAVQDI